MGFEEGASRRYEEDPHKASPPARELPRYRCHKEVQALKIRMIRRRFVEGTTTVLDATITPEHGYDGFTVSGDYVRKHDPKVGGYYVRYADGYESWSPAAAFEEGYTRI